MAGHPLGGTAGAAFGGAAGTALGGAAGSALGGAGAGGAAATAAGGTAGTGPGGTAGTAAVVGGAGGSVTGPPAFAITVQLASDILSTAPTTVGIVTWSLNRANLTEAHISFGLDTTYGMTAPVDLGATNYRTVLVGMKAAKAYHFQIFATDNSAQTYASGDQTLTTGALPAALPLPSFTPTVSGAFDAGFIIGSFWIGSYSPTAFIIDTDGDVVWWYTDPTTVPYGTGGNGLSRARLSANSHDVWLINAQTRSALRRVSIDTLDVQSYPDTAGTHDICAVSGDTIAYLGWTQGDLTDGGWACDKLIELDKAGNTKHVFDSTGVFAGGSGCHGSSLRYAQKTDQYLFADRENDVLVIDRAGTIQWRLSDKVAGGHKSWGGIQHGVQLLDASLLIFANQGASVSQSQAIEYGLDGSVLRKFASRGHTDFLGDVQRLPSGGTMINYSTTFQMVDANDNVVVQFPALGLGYAEFRQNLYGPPLDIQGD
jgi:hypothetical protein